MSATSSVEQANVTQPTKGQNEMSFETDRGPLFVVGMWRSGTSLLYRLINQHPQICLMYEGDLAVLEPLFIWGSPRAKWTEYWDFWSGALRRHTIDPASIPTDIKDLRTAMRRIYRAYAGPAIWGCKSPNYYDRLQELHRMFPNARFVIIWRDPADVCRSVLRAGQVSYSWFNRRGMFHRALLGHLVMKKECDALIRRGAQVHQIQYEDLIKVPEITTRAICEFLNLPFEPKMASLKGSDHSAIDPAAQHKKVKSDRIIVDDEASEILTDAQKQKVGSYVRLWQARYQGWPRVRNQADLPAGKPPLGTRLADWTIYRGFRLLDGIRKWVYCLAPLWLLNAYRVVAGKPALLLRQKTSEEKPKTSSAAL
jgi:hypothetical protein